MKIKQLAVRDPEMVEKLIDVWTRSVRATHTFLNEDDIRRLTPVVRQGLTEIPVLVTAETDEGNPAAHGFYEHMGFKVAGRSEFDDYGNPFPILHLILETDIRTGKE